jgi:lysophospholipase L1-like esterase
MAGSGGSRPSQHRVRAGRRVRTADHDGRKLRLSAGSGRRLAVAFAVAVTTSLAVSNVEAEQGSDQLPAPQPSAPNCEWYGSVEFSRQYSVVQPLGYTSDYQLTGRGWSGPSGDGKCRGFVQNYFRQYDTALSGVWWRYTAGGTGSATYTAGFPNWSPGGFSVAFRGDELMLYTAESGGPDGGGSSSSSMSWEAGADGGCAVPGAETSAHRIQAVVMTCSQIGDSNGSNEVFTASIRMRRTICDWTVDSDGDGVSDCEEYELETDPNKPDKDGDEDPCPVGDPVLSDRVAEGSHDDGTVDGGAVDLPPQCKDDEDDDDRSAGRWLVALGDSYSSGEGAYAYFPLTNVDSNRCHISQVSYPFVAVDQLKGSPAAFDQRGSVACSGAVAADILSEDFCGPKCAPSKSDPRHAPQIARLATVRDFAESEGAKIEVVTVGIGGNDAGFSTVVTRCLLPGPSCVPVFEPILGGSTPDGGVSVNVVIQRVGAVIDAIHQTVPNARIVLVGYPVFMEVPGQLSICEMARDEAAWVRGQVLDLNRRYAGLAAFKDSALPVPVDFLSLDAAYDTHGLCGKGEEYVNGLVLDTIGPDDNDGCFYARNLGAAKVCNESFHPKAIGHAASGLLLANCLVSRNACGTPSSETVTVTKLPSITVKPMSPFHAGGCVVDGTCLRPFESAYLTVTGFQPGESTTIKIYSEPVVLGTAIADSSGAVTTTVTIPGDTTPGSHRLVVMADDPTGGIRAAYVDIEVAAALPPPLVPVSPGRVLETRTGAEHTTVDGKFQRIGRRAAGSTIELQVTGRAGVPANAAAVVMNLTAVRPDAAGFLTVYPCGEKRPLTSNVNYTPGSVSPNAVLAKVGTGGKVCIFNLAATDMVADINGYVPDGGSPFTVSPGRVLETRTGAEHTTVDGKFQRIGRRVAGSTIELQVTGRAGVPANAAAVVMNLTAVRPDAAGFLTVYPCGEKRPLTSNVNYTPGSVSPNAVLAKVGTGGKVCIFNLAATDMIADINGYIGEQS